MSRYDADEGIEGQSEPGSRGRVLRNKKGIRSVRIMDRAEYDALLAAQERYAASITSATRFSSKLICCMHFDWLGGIYEWAGRYRTVEMAKGAFRWPPAFLVAQNMVRVERETLSKCTPCRPAEV